MSNKRLPGEWSDEDLLSADLSIAGRPDSDPSLSRERPPGDATIRLLRAMAACLFETVGRA